VKRSGKAAPLNLWPPGSRLLFIYNAVSNISCKTNGDSDLNKHITLSEICTANQGILVANTGHFLRALAMGKIPPNAETLGECIVQQRGPYVEIEAYSPWLAHTVDGSGNRWCLDILQIPSSAPLFYLSHKARPKGYFCRVMKPG